MAQPTSTTTTPSPDEKKKNVLILGAGFGGLGVAKALDAAAGQNFNVTIVTPREFMLVKFGALRAAMQGGQWTKRVTVPFPQSLKNVKVIIAKATKVDGEKRTVLLSTGETLSYDVLVCATGSRNFSVAEPPVGSNTLAQTEAYYQATRMAIQSSKSIVVVGGGPTALETMGELAEAVKLRGGEAKLTLVVGKLGLLSSTVPPLPPSFMSHWRALLARQNVEVIEDTIRFMGDMLTSSAVCIPDDKRVKLESGKVLEGVDLVLFALGSRIQSQDIYPAGWIDEATGELKTDSSTLLLKGTKNVFGVGDLAHTKTTKTAYFASEDAKTVAKNVKLVLEGEEPTAKIMRMKTSILIIPFGPDKGLSYLPWGEAGAWLTYLIKGKGLFANRFWKTTMGKSAPSV